MTNELSLAIALIWGHLNVRQFGHAYTLARGCAVVWPQEQRIPMMMAYAAVELGHPLDAATLKIIRDCEWPEWRDLILRRARALSLQKEDNGAE